MHSLAKDPAARFPTASAMVAAITQALNMPIPKLAIPAPESTNTANSPTFSNPLSAPQSPDATDATLHAPIKPSTYHTFSASPTTTPPAVATPSSSPLVTPWHGISNNPVTPWHGISAEELANNINLPTISTPQSYAIFSPPVPGNASNTPTSIPASQIANQVQQQAYITPPAAVAPPTGSAPALPSARKKSRSQRWLYPLVTILAVLTLLSSGIAVFLLIHKTPPVLPAIVGHAFFSSSEQLNQFSDTGIADEVQLSLQNISDPQPGKSYYVWLLSDSKTDAIPLGIGTLNIKNGQGSLSYKGDEHHSDLLALYNAILVTEEDTSPPPINHSLDSSTWRFYAGFSEVPNPNDKKFHFSLLDHLRHLLAKEPLLYSLGLPGGLDIWLFRNTEKLWEYSGSIRDSGDPAFIERQLIRIMDYLDGKNIVKTELPPNTPLLIDPIIAQAALLEFDPLHQSPPGHLKHIGIHLADITELSTATPEQQRLASQINVELNNAQGWLGQVHQDALTLLQMSKNDKNVLLQPQARTLLNDLFVQANYAFVGQTDPATNAVKGGVVQIHYNIQNLATLDLKVCTSVNEITNSCA
jgi:eukaryotic-like serine/threonine-protein kinase